MKLTIQTPDATIVDMDNVVSVQARTEDGGFGILPGHIPMTSALDVALVSYLTPDDAKHTVAVMGGVLNTDGSTVTILTIAAEHANDIDQLRASEALQRAEERLKSRTADVDVNRAKLSVARAQTRLSAIR